MPAGVVAPDIATLDTAAGMTLAAVFFYPRQSATGDALNEFGINATAVHDAVARKVNIMTTGIEHDALLACDISKPSGKLPHRRCIRQDIANIPHPASDFTIVVKKADDAALGVSGKFTCQTTESCCMPFRSKTIGQHNRIVTPHHPFRANQSGELPEHLQNFAIFRNSRFKRCIIGSQRKQEIVCISQSINFRQTRQKVFRIFCPENNRINSVGREQNPAHLLRLHGVTHQRLPRSQAIHQPLAIKCRYISSSACADDHNKLSIPLCTECFGLFEH